MPKRRPILVLLSLAAVGCAGLAGSDPVRVQLAGLEPLPGEGLEWRMLLKLRVQSRELPDDRVLSCSGRWPGEE